MQEKKTYELWQDSPENTFKISLLNTTVIEKTKNMHQHDHFEILHLTPTEYYVHVDNYKYLANSNSIVVFPPSLKHKVIRKTLRMTRLLINFKYDFVKPIADLLNIDLSLLFSDPVLYFSNQQIAELEDLTKKMLVEYKEKISPNQNAYLKLLFAQYLFILTQAVQKARPEHLEELKVNHVIDYLNRNYFEDITLDFLSNRFYISKFELCRKIKEITGQTFSSYLAQLRVNHAREYLESSELTVDEISVLAGYHSIAYFSTVFKRIIGVSPAQYRQNRKKIN